MTEVVLWRGGLPTGPARRDPVPCRGIGPGFSQRWQGFIAVPPATSARPGEGHFPGLAAPPEPRR
jgi:hypothetical protein